MIYETDYYVGSDLNGDSLSHHGVPNQKWGVRHGPPYPVQRGKDVHYNVGKMSDKTKTTLSKAGKIPGAIGNAAKTVAKKTNSSFQKWKENKKADLAVKDTNSKLVKNWQKKQLRISDMTNQELQQRIDRKRLEETYKHALRGDFSDPKSWKNSKQGKDGKKAADSILAKVGNAAVEGLAKGLSSKIEQTMTSKARAKNARKEARRDAIAEVWKNADKEREEYKAKQANESWKERREYRAQNRQERQNAWNSNRGNDGAMDPIMGSPYNPNRPVGLGSGNEYWAGPYEAWVL